MFAFARGSLLLLMTICTPAWSSGFCDILPGHGSGCPQIRSTDMDLVSGSIFADFSDLDLQPYSMASTPIGFALDFSQLSVAENTSVTVLEIAFAGTLPHSRVLTMSVTKNVDYALRFDWLRADASWSSATPVEIPPTVVASLSITIPAPETSVGVTVAPYGPMGEDVFVDGEFVGRFHFSLDPAPHTAVRLRTGVIGGDLLKDDMTTQYVFVSPHVND